MSAQEFKEEAMCLPHQVIFAVPQLTDRDSDLETEADLPHALESFVAESVLQKLEPKEKKRQEVINELFYTARAHVRNLKVMQRLFYRPMISDSSIASPDFVKMLFPNIDDMVYVHSALNNDFKKRRSESQEGIVDKVSDILVNRFTGAEGTLFGNVCATFCQDQTHALERLRTKEQSANDGKFIQFLQTALTEPLCRRLSLKDLLPTVVQHLTVYPLLIERLMSYASDSNEVAQLQAALVGCKNILDHVNSAVQDCENRHKLEGCQQRLDKKQSSDQFQNFDFTKHRMVHEGQLVWRLSREKEIEVHVVLLEHAIVLLQRRDAMLLLKFPRNERSNDRCSRLSPVIALSTMLLRGVANDERALYVVSSFNSEPQCHELVASSADDCKKWMKYINQAAATYRDSIQRRRLQSGGSSLWLPDESVAL